MPQPIEKIANHPELFPTLNEDSRQSVVKSLAEKAIVDIDQLYGLLLVEGIQENEDIKKIVSPEGRDAILARLREILGEQGKHEIRPWENLPLSLGLISEGKSMLLNEGKALGVKRFQPVDQNATPENKALLGDAVKILKNAIQSSNSKSYYCCEGENLIPIRNQGSRSTCVAFAFTYANEYFSYVKTGKKTPYKYFSAPNQLSQQYLYLKAKEMDGNVDCGTSLVNGANVLTAYGQCIESYLLYNSQGGCADNGTSNPMLDSIASRYNAPCIRLAPDDIEAFKAAINCNGYVVVGIQVYASWLGNRACKERGVITMPLTNEPEYGKHALALVAYGLDDSIPGGGAFIAKNSWGTDWAPSSSQRAGYAIIPFQYILDHCVDAYTILCP
jgi:C1A family cysteine protease